MVWEGAKCEQEISYQEAGAIDLLRWFQQFPAWGVDGGANASLMIDEGHFQESK